MFSDKFFFAISLFAENPSFTTTFEENNSTPNSKNGQDWSNLPKFILFYLLKFLNLRTDLPRLRAVCPSWRSKLPLNQIPKLPLGFDSPPLPSQNLPVLLYYTRFFLISQLGNPNSVWIVRVSDVTHKLNKNKFQLHSPIDSSRTNYFHVKPSLKGEINILDCNVIELSSCFSLLGGGSSVFDTRLTKLSEKVVGNWDLNSNYLVTVLAKVNEQNGGGLVFLMMGKEDWIDIKEMNVVERNERKILRNFEVGDIVFYDGEFYALDLNSWKIGVIDVNDIDLDKVPLMEFINGPKLVHQVISGVSFINVNGDLFAMKGVYFVPSKDGLYLVIEINRYEYNVGIKESLIVYELDEIECEWKKVESIGEQVFFIGSDVAFSTSSENVPGWKSGSICLFTGRCRGMLLDKYVEARRGEMPEGLEMLDELKYEEYWNKFRMFNMEESEKGIVGFEELSKEVYTGVFFPPPPWVKFTCRKLDDVVVELKNLKLCGDCDGGNVAVNLGDMILEEVE